jgi:thiol:disulfide interchange protein DsbA
MRLRSLFILLMLLSSTTWAQTKWQEDTHYKVISQTASAAPKVTEVFSYWCPACYKFEALVPQLKKSLAQGVSFNKVHVNFNGSAPKQAQDDATAAMLAANVLGMGDEFTKALFDAIHSERKKIADMADILEVFVAAGGDMGKMLKLTSSFGIRTPIAKNNKATQGITSVPSIIVNDKYQAIFTRNMTPEQYIELINWLTLQK